MSKRLLLTSMIIVAAAGITLMLQLSSKNTSAPTDGDGQWLFGRFSPAEVERVVLRDAEEIIDLSKNEVGAWILKGQNFPINSQSLFVTLEEYADAKIADTLSADPNKHSLFGVEESATKSVSISYGGKEWLVYLGKTRTGGLGTYVRRKGEKHTHLVDDIRVPTDLAYWLNLKFIDINPADIQQISLVRNNAAAEVDIFAKNGQYFTGPDRDQSADANMIEQTQKLVDLLSPLRPSALAKAGRRIESAQLSLKIQLTNEAIRLDFSPRASAATGAGEEEGGQEQDEKVFLAVQIAQKSSSTSKLAFMTEYTQDRLFVYEGWRYKQLVKIFEALGVSPSQ